MQQPSSRPPASIQTAAWGNDKTTPRTVRSLQSTSSPSPNVRPIPANISRPQLGHMFKVVNGVPLLKIEDPVFEVREAAAILGLSKELLEKWRERGQGPEYLQYHGHGGPVRYRLSALESFKATHTVRPARQPRTRRRKQQ